MQYFWGNSPELSNFIEHNVGYLREYAAIFIAPWLARGGSQCNLRNASLPVIFIGLVNYGRNYFVPPTEALASTDTNTFATNLPLLDVMQTTCKKNPQLRLAGADSSSCKMDLCSLIKMLN